MSSNFPRVEQPSPSREGYQTFVRTQSESTLQHAKEKSSATIHRALAMNPFAPENKKIIDGLVTSAKKSQMESAESIEDIATSPQDTELQRFDAIRGVILSEPEGPYDEEFAKMPRPEQANKLREELTTSAFMTMDLTQEVLSHMDEYMTLDDATIYARLSEKVFQSTDYDEIARQYSQKQRRGYRLSILNFIQDMHHLKQMDTKIRQEVGDDPGEITKYILGGSKKDLQEFTGNVDVRLTPAGYIVSLYEDDYEKFSGGGKSAGIFKNDLDTDMPQELSSMLIFINKGAPSDPKTAKEIEWTEQHEIRHAVMRRYHARFDFSEDDYEDLTNISKESKESSADTVVRDARVKAGILRGYSQNRVVDEIIAYRAGGGDALAPHKFTTYYSSQTLIDIEQNLQNDNRLSTEQKQKVWDMYLAQFHGYLRNARSGLVIADALYNTPFPIPDTQRKYMEKVDRDQFLEALLQNTELDKFPRLAKLFLGKTVREIQAELFASDARIKNEEDAARLATVLDDVSQYGPDIQKQMRDIWRQKGAFKGLNYSEGAYLVPSFLPYLNQLLRVKIPEVTLDALPHIQNILTLMQDKPIPELDEIKMRTQEIQADYEMKGNEEIMKLATDVGDEIDRIQQLQNVHFA